MELPPSHKPYTDKYFLRANEILKADGLNPFVRYQAFIRKGPGTTAGLEEAISVIDKYSKLAEHGGRILALRDGSEFQPRETQMLIEGRVQDLIELETMYLGVLSAATTTANGGQEVDPAKVKTQMAKVVEAAKGRPVSYFGARHWHWSRDAEIAKAAYEGGASSCSTDIGAAFLGQKGIGTIPHALENIYAAVYGKEHAVVEATKAFDRVIAPGVPRIALIDYDNHEIRDSIATARALEGSLGAVRIDTCGENLAEGASTMEDYPPYAERIKHIFHNSDPRYCFGHGVTVSGTYALRKELDATGHKDVQIILSSGFGDDRKVKAFVDAEEALGIRLFDALGVGGVYDSWMATSDIVAVGPTRDLMESMSKAGRPYRLNPRLEVMLGK